MSRRREFWTRARIELLSTRTWIAWAAACVGFAVTLAVAMLLRADSPRTVGALYLAFAALIPTVWRDHGRAPPTSRSVGGVGFALLTAPLVAFAANVTRAIELGWLVAWAIGLGLLSATISAALARFPWMTALGALAVVLTAATSPIGQAPFEPARWPALLAVFIASATFLIPRVRRDSARLPTT